MAYVHSFCKNVELVYVNTDIIHIDSSKLNDIIENITKSKHLSKQRKWKFSGLEEYCFKSTKKTNKGDFFCLINKK